MVPFRGNNCYKRLTPVIDNPPDIFQQKMNDLFHGFEFIRALHIQPFGINKKRL